MHIDPALLSALSALVGALMGGTASLVGAIYTQRNQDRLQRVAREATKREQVYADFIMSASKLLLDAYIHDGITLNADDQHLVGLLNRMRLFAPPNVINEAEAVIRGLIEISLKPSVDFRKVAMEKLSKNQELDLLLPFSLACRADSITWTRPSADRQNHDEICPRMCRSNSFSFSPSSIWRDCRRVYVCFGSKADMCRTQADVRFVP